MRGATGLDTPACNAERISIHAPRAGGDRTGKASRRAYTDFNPRPPCGGRLLNRHILPSAVPFQSTPPVRGATITAVCKYYLCIFQSTPPVRGATVVIVRVRYVDDISIHAPRAGGDGSPPGTYPDHQHFNPRPPCGGRHGAPVVGEAFSRLFQSTPPVRGATEMHILEADELIFQSTPPVRGATARLRYCTQTA